MRTRGEHWVFRAAAKYMRWNRYFRSMVVRAEREKAHAHQVRKFQRLEEELVQLQDQREQVELEQEQLRQEEISFRRPRVWRDRPRP